MADNRDEHPREFIRRHLEELVRQMKEKYGIEGGFSEIPASEVPDAMSELQAASALSGVDPNEMEQVNAYEQELKRKADILLAGSDIKTALKDTIEEAHTLMHQVGDKLAMIAYLTSLLERDPEEEEDDRYEQSWRRRIRKLSMRMIEAGMDLCDIFHNVMDGKPIPGRHRDTSEEPDDWEAFAKKIGVPSQPRGNA